MTVISDHVSKTGAKISMAKAMLMDVVERMEIGVK